MTSSLVRPHAGWLPLAHMTLPAIAAVLPTLDFTYTHPSLLAPPDKIPHNRPLRLSAVSVLACHDARYSSPSTVSVTWDVDPPCILMIKRTDRGVHAGQIGFPGGIRDGTEELIDTAQRELFEELGIDHRKHGVRILNQSMPMFQTNVSSTLCRPFLGVLDRPLHVDRDLVLSEGEVAKVLMLPIRDLIQENVYDAEGRVRVNDLMVWTGPTFRLHGVTIWGLSARILVAYLHGLATSVG